MLPPYDKFPHQKVAPWFLLPLNQWGHVRQTFRRRCWAVRPALQSNSSSCLVLIPHWQLGHYLLSIGGSYSLTAQHSQDSITVNVWHLPREHLLTEAQHSTLYRILLLICSSNVGGKIVSSWHRNSGPVTHLWTTGKHKVLRLQKLQPPDRTQRHMSFTNTENFPYPGRNSFSTDWPVLPIVTQKGRSHTIHQASS